MVSATYVMAATTVTVDVCPASWAMTRYLPAEEVVEAPFFLHHELAEDLAASPLRHYRVIGRAATGTGMSRRA